MKRLSRALLATGVILVGCTGGYLAGRASGVSESADVHSILRACDRDEVNLQWVGGMIGRLNAGERADLAEALFWKILRDAPAPETWRRGREFYAGNYDGDWAEACGLDLTLAGLAFLAQGDIAVDVIRGHMNELSLTEQKRVVRYLGVFGSRDAVNAIVEAILSGPDEVRCVGIVTLVLSGADDWVYASPRSSGTAGIDVPGNYALIMARYIRELKDPNVRRAWDYTMRALNEESLGWSVRIESRIEKVKLAERGG